MTPLQAIPGPRSGDPPREVPSIRAAPPGGDRGARLGSAPGDAALLREAGARTRKIRRAAGVAALNGWTAAVFAFVAIVTGFSSPAALVLGVGLGIGAFCELRGRRKLLVLDARGARALAMNQAVIAGSVIVYCVWSTVNAMNHSTASIPGMDAQGIDEAVQEQFGQSLQSLVSVVSVGLYGTVIVLTVIFQGLMAWYYLSRGRLIAEHHRLTPAWIRDVQRGLGA